MIIIIENVRNRNGRIENFDNDKNGHVQGHGDCCDNPLRVLFDESPFPCHHRSAYLTSILLLFELG